MPSVYGSLGIARDCKTRSSWSLSLSTTNLLGTKRKLPHRQGIAFSLSLVKLSCTELCVIAELYEEFH
ncbi:hypothetical protein NL676_025560 [Syzygium grande]|nr:hypothetical protein NL676_025560 [Syzygium grande]